MKHEFGILGWLHGHRMVKRNKRYTYNCDYYDLVCVKCGYRQPYHRSASIGISLKDGPPYDPELDKYNPWRHIEKD